MTMIINRSNFVQTKKTHLAQSIKFSVVLYVELLCLLSLVHTYWYQLNL